MEYSWSKGGNVILVLRFLRFTHAFTHLYNLTKKFKFLLKLGVKVGHLFGLLEKPIQRD